MRLLYRAFDYWRDRLRNLSWNSGHASGRRGEDLAYRFLQKRGYTVVARNYQTRNRSAEVDLIARDGEVLVFVEVKSRATEDFGTPDRAVDPEKQRNLQRAAAEYVRRSHHNEELIRFDIVSVVQAPAGSKAVIHHIPDAFGRQRSL